MNGVGVDICYYLSVGSQFWFVLVFLLSIPKGVAYLCWYLTTLSVGKLSQDTASLCHPLRRPKWLNQAIKNSVWVLLFILMFYTVFLPCFLPQAPPGNCGSEGRGLGDGSQDLWLICKPEELGMKGSNKSQSSALIFIARLRKEKRESHEMLLGSRGNRESASL